MTICDLFVKFDEQDIWVVLYFLGQLKDNVGAKSKYIAKILQEPYQKVVSKLIKLEKQGLVKKHQTFKSLGADGYSTHWWIISKEGKDLIDSRKSLDTKRHFQTTQRLNELIPNPQSPFSTPELLE